MKTGTVKSYSCSSMQFRHWPRAGPLNAPPLCCGCISVTLSKHFGHLWGLETQFSLISDGHLPILLSNISNYNLGGLQVLIFNKV